MADVTGLVIGAVALATLFSTCIDLFDTFELGKNYAADYHLACSKIGLLKLRLSSWGHNLNVEQPGDEHPVLRIRWSEQQHVVAQSLFGIRRIFEEAFVLERKYELTQQKVLSVRPLPTNRLLKSRSKTTPSAVKESNGWNFFRRRASWAVHDKKRFDGLIDDLAFLIDQLDIVKHIVIDNPATSNEMSGSQTNVPASNANSSAPRKNSPAEAAEAAPSKALKELPETMEASGSSSNLTAGDIVQIVPHLSGHVVQAKQVVKGPGLIGDVDGTPNNGPRHIMLVEQEAEGVGIIGSTSVPALRELMQKPTVDEVETTKKD